MLLVNFIVIAVGWNVSGLLRIPRDLGELHVILGDWISHISLALVTAIGASLRGVSWSGNHGSILGIRYLCCMSFGVTGGRSLHRRRSKRPGPLPSLSIPWSIVASGHWGLTWLIVVNTLHMVTLIPSPRKTVVRTSAFTVRELAKIRVHSVVVHSMSFPLVAEQAGVGRELQVFALAHSGSKFALVGLQVRIQVFTRDTLVRPSEMMVEKTYA